MAGNGRAAAVRKIGLSARFSYLIFGFISLLWVLFYSLEQMEIGNRAFYELFVYEGRMFSLEGRQILQETFLVYAVIFISWFLLTQSRYSLVRAPSYIPGFKGFSYFLLFLYYASTPDVSVFSQTSFAEHSSVGGVIFMMIIFGSVIAKGIEFMFGLLEKIPPFLANMIVILFWLGTYSVDLMDGLIVYWVFKVVIVPVLIFAVPVYYLAIKDYIKEHPDYRKMFVLGRGGAARWGGLYSFVKYDFNGFMRGSEYKNAPIYCGQTLWYDDIKLNGRHIGLDSDSMMLTVAAMGGGKSLYAAWNTLLSWKGGAFILDPKGEHAERTAGFRSNAKAVHILDPWGSVPDLYNGACATFNPLEEIDVTGPNARDEIFQIVESCILQEAEENANSKHFRENAQKIMMGVIAHVLTHYPEEHHNLPTIYDIILTGAPDGVASDPKAFDALVDRMAINEAMGRAPMDAAKVLKEAGENERGGFITTLATGLSWVNTPVLRPILLHSSFKMKDMKTKRETVYLVIPFEHMKNHSRFLRTVVSMGLMSCRELAEHNYKTLFLLDEFPQLGTFKPIKEGLVTLRSRDVKIWMHLQNLGQLKERYGNWQDFMSSCDKQFFAVNDHESAEEISKMLGEYVERWIEGKEGATSYIDKNRPLRSPSEVLEELRKGSKLQYVLPADGLPMRLKLISFKKNFKKYGTVKGNKHG